MDSSCFNSDSVTIHDYIRNPSCPDEVKPYDHHLDFDCTDKIYSNGPSRSPEKRNRPVETHQRENTSSNLKQSCRSAGCHTYANQLSIPSESRPLHHLPLGPNHSKIEWLRYEDWLNRRKEYRSRQPFNFFSLWRSSVSPDSKKGGRLSRSRSVDSCHRHTSAKTTRHSRRYGSSSRRRTSTKRHIHDEKRDRSSRDMKKKKNLTYSDDSDRKSRRDRNKSRHHRHGSSSSQSSGRSASLSSFSSSSSLPSKHLHSKKGNKIQRRQHEERHDKKKHKRRSGKIHRHRSYSSSSSSSLSNTMSNLSYDETSDSSSLEREKEMKKKLKSDKMKKETRKKRHQSNSEETSSSQEKKLPSDSTMLYTNTIECTESLNERSSEYNIKDPLVTSKEQKKNQSSQTLSLQSGTQNDERGFDNPPVEAMNSCDYHEVPSTNKHLGSLPNVSALQDTLLRKPTNHTNEDEDEEDDLPGPKPLEANEKLSKQSLNYGGALRPGEGEAMAQFVQTGKRIPRRGEVGLTADEIEAFERLGYVMSGSRHRRMNAVRIRKENQVYSAEEQRALAMYSYEERANRDAQLIADLREMLKQQNERFLNESMQEKIAQHKAKEQPSET